MFTLSVALKAQGVNMDRFIRLEVKKGEPILLQFASKLNGTKVRIVSGDSIEDNLPAGEDLSTAFPFIAGANEMFIYGNISTFECGENYENITSIDLSRNLELEKLYCYCNDLKRLDVSMLENLSELECDNNKLTSLDISNNTKLERLVCYENNFSTETIDQIYCSLPQRTENIKGSLFVLNSNFDENYDNVIATNKQNAIAKNWNVWYYDDYDGELANTDIPATTGTYECEGGEEPESFITMQVTKGNKGKLRLLGATDYTPIRIVNGDSEANLVINTGWTNFEYVAEGTEMTIYGDVEGFRCSDNNITALDVRNNKKLMSITCFNNKLKTLDISQNEKLIGLYCHGNELSTEAIDEIYCALPDRSGGDTCYIEPIESASSDNYDIVLATNKSNALKKKWKVAYYSNDTPIPDTHGNYQCGSSPSDVYDLTDTKNNTLVYPNPVESILHIKTKESKFTVRIYNLQGKLLLEKQNDKDLNVSILPAGMYVFEMITSKGVFTQKVIRS